MSASNRFRADLRLLGRSMSPDLDSALTAVRRRAEPVGSAARARLRLSTVAGLALLLVAMGIVSPGGARAGSPAAAPAAAGSVAVSGVAQLAAATKGSPAPLAGLVMCDRPDLRLLSAADTGGGETLLWLTLQNTGRSTCQAPVDRCASTASVQDAYGTTVYSTSLDRAGLCGGAVPADRLTEARSFVALGPGQTASISFRWGRGGAALPGSYRVIGSWAGFNFPVRPPDTELTAFRIDAGATSFLVR